VQNKYNIIPLFPSGNVNMATPLPKIRSNSFKWSKCIAKTLFIYFKQRSKKSISNGYWDVNTLDFEIVGILNHF